jgi:superfamily I DNA/RNA helicase
MNNRLIKQSLPLVLDLKRGERRCQSWMCSSILLVVSPGSGETTSCPAVLEFVFMDGVGPTAIILATTFSCKAAAELRSRILSWGSEQRWELMCTLPTLTLSFECLV